MSAIVLGVSGGVAAYKAAFVLRAFTEAGHDVRVVPTPGALHFVGAATFEALSGNPVTTDPKDRPAVDFRESLIADKDSVPKSSAPAKK